MKLIIDSAIPYIKGILEPYGEVLYKKGSDITSADVRECDGMIIRTRTQCNTQMLEGSHIRFIGTATIGYDHIDMEYCNKNGIKVVTAAGCNALGVVQYVLCAMQELAKIKPIRTVGIVGVGNVGGALNTFLINKGYKTLLNDPPRAAQEGDFNNTPLDKLLKECDLVSLHTPLDETTRGMVSDQFFRQLGSGKFFINASRGEVVNEDALLRAEITAPVIDVWCNEPEINTLLLEKAFITTPHIAGYSEQGKANGTAMMVAAVSSFFGIEDLGGWYPSEVKQNTNREIITSTYDLIADSNSLKNNEKIFEELRNNYKYRKEFF